MSSENVHSDVAVSLARFSLISLGNLPRMMGTSRSPYVSSDFPKEERPRVWLSIVS